MPQLLEIIDIGELPNDGTGDPLRVAFDKINNNFSKIPTLNQGGPNQAIQYNNDGLSGGTANLLYDVSNNAVRTDSDIIPITTNVVNLGSDQKRYANLWLAKQDSLHIGNVSISERLNVLNFYSQANNQVQADLQVGNIYATGDLFAIGNVTSTGNMNIDGGIGLNGGISINSSKIVTTTNAANQVIFELPQNKFSTVKFQITSYVSDSNDTQSATITATKRQDGIRANYAVYGTVFIGNVVTRYNVDIAFGNLRLMVSPLINVEIQHLFSYQADKGI